MNLSQVLRAVGFALGVVKWLKPSVLPKRGPKVEPLERAAALTQENLRDVRALRGEIAKERGK